MNFQNQRVLLTSTSPVKFQAYKNAFTCEPNFRMGVEGCGNPEQPVGYLETLVCCKNRIEHVIEKSNVGLGDYDVGDYEVRDYDIIMAIENGIQKIADECFDVVHVVCYDTKNGLYFHKSGAHFKFENYLWEETENKKENIKTTLGWSITIGDIVAEKFGYNKKNWIKDYVALNNPLDRVSQISSVLLALDKMDTVQVNTRFVVDYPKKGIIFQDLGSVWANPTLNRRFFDLLLLKVQNDLLTNGSSNKIDVVVGLESRGFGIGHALANQIGAGFVMVRKPKKLVGARWSVSYEKEYGSDILELQQGVIQEGSNVLIVDDLIATGGSLAAAVKLVKQVKNVNILGCLTCTKVYNLFQKAKEKIDEKIVTIF